MYSCVYCLFRTPKDLIYYEAILTVQWCLRGKRHNCAIEGVKQQAGQNDLMGLFYLLWFESLSKHFEAARTKAKLWEHKEGKHKVMHRDYKRKEPRYCVINFEQASNTSAVTLINQDMIKPQGIRRGITIPGCWTSHSPNLVNIEIRVLC